MTAFWQDDDAVNAEAFINKASFLVSNSQHEVLNLQYKVQSLKLWFNLNPLWKGVFAY